MFSRVAIGGAHADHVTFLVSGLLLSSYFKSGTKISINFVCIFFTFELLSPLRHAAYIFDKQIQSYTQNPKVFLIFIKYRLK